MEIPVLVALGGAAGLILPKAIGGNRKSEDVTDTRQTTTTSLPLHNNRALKHDMRHMESNSIGRSSDQSITPMYTIHHGRRANASSFTSAKITGSPQDIMSSAALLATPYAAVAMAGGGAFVSAAYMYQVSVAAILRITCSTPIISYVAGVSNVLTASIFSGAAGEFVVGESKRKNGGKKAVQKFLSSAEEMTTDALIGAASFLAVGGRFRSTLSSDVRYPGAFAKESIRANGYKYANHNARRDLGTLFKRYGCHHCGTKKGDFVGDHMPPNGVLAKRRSLRSLFEKLLWRFRYGSVHSLRQRYYPQCKSCSQIQSSAIARNLKKIRIHGGTIGPYMIVGALAALRHYGGANEEVYQNLRRNWDEGGKQLAGLACVFVPYYKIQKYMDSITK